MSPRSVIRRHDGFTLIELMIAMVLGLIVIAGVISIFLANQRVYRTNNALGDVQDSSRIAFEMMARDIREAGLTGCSSLLPSRIANVLSNGPINGGTTWWANWDNSVHGYEGGSSTIDPAISGVSGVGVYMPNTDSLELMGADPAGVTVATDDETTGTFSTNETSSSLKTGDIAIVCDPDHAALVQFTAVNSTGTTLVHIADSGSPGNCSAGLGYPTACTSAGNAYTFRSNALIAKLSAVDWYIGKNADGGSSLYRVNLTPAGSTPTTPQEMVRNITDMQIQYHQSGLANFADAGSISDWTGVDALRVTFTLESSDQRAGTDTKPLKRTFTSTTSLRNRVPLT